MYNHFLTTFEQFSFSYSYYLLAISLPFSLSANDLKMNLPV